MTIYEYLNKQKDICLPCYVYDISTIYKQIHKLQQAFANFSLLYSLKANPNIEIVKIMQNQSVGIDAASVNEVFLANQLGYKKEDIYFSAPGKSLEDISLTYDRCVIVADSVSEIFRINQFAETKSIIVSIGLRINILPSNDIDSFEIMSGENSHFGITSDNIIQNIESIKAFQFVHIIGIHVYLASQILDWQQILSNIRDIIKIVYFIEGQLEKKLLFINFGGGFGIPYDEKESELDLDKLSEGLTNILEIENTLIYKKLIIESGRYLVAQSGYFVSSVLDIKDIRESTKIIIRGGMNGFFRPIFTKQPHLIEVINDNTEQIICDVVGNSCTPLDVLAKNIKLKRCNVGDIVLIHNAGAYGLTMSLNQFISPTTINEFFLI
jgi:diaminopimelate decarboxylase